MKCDVAFTHIHIHTDSPLFQVSIICKAEVLPSRGGGPVGALEDDTTASFVKMAPPISSTRASHGERVAKWRTSIHAFGFLLGVFVSFPSQPHCCEGQCKEQYESAFVSGSGCSCRYFTLPSPAFLGAAFPSPFPPRLFFCLSIFSYSISSFRKLAGYVSLDLKFYFLSKDFVVGNIH